MLHWGFEALHLGAKSRAGAMSRAWLFSERGVLWITDFSGGKFWHVLGRFWTWMGVSSCSPARSVVGLD